MEVKIVPFPDVQPKVRMLLGEWLCAHDMLNEDQLRLALHEQKQHADLLGRVLIKLRFVKESQLLEA
ncbi:MAG: hypothetical protein EB059_00335 [Alphaproteobacteria bacterium]|nr:hypothetical protein [Alphaproteobacteria bacterium]